MVPVAMLLTFITGMVGFISSTLSLLIGYMAYVSLAYIILIAEVFAKLPFAAYVVPVFPFYVVVIVYLLYAFILRRLYVKASRSDRPLIPKNDGWTVEEESTLLPSISKSTSGDTPIFFR
jgi:membrane protein implicated in regulation of membrane protease activity